MAQQKKVAGPTSTCSTSDAEPTRRPNNPQFAGIHQVAPGDTLWDLAERTLGDGQRWPELYEQNKGVIGDSPDLILPGQLLSVPEPLDGGVCVEPADDPAQDMSPLEAPEELPPMELEDYLEDVRTIEAYYEEQAKQSGQPYDNGAAISGLRAMYGYDDALWDKMIPDAPEVAAPEGLGAMDRLRPMGANGERRARLVRLPDGSVIDPGHLFTGIDAQLHPDTSWEIDAYRIDNRDASTWSGDVGQAIVGYQGGATADQAWERDASEADLLADLDGVNLGSGWSLGGGVADQLAAYYSSKDGGVTKRFSAFLKNRELSHQGGQLTDEAKEIIRAESDDFAEAYDRRREGRVSQGLGVFGGRFDENDERSMEMTDRFIGFIEQGLADEQEGVCTPE
ncbi:MAG TPA: LysM peptidoglycan-binding domain-containing protein [Myxococcota bacterium]|nr:LysM peptidoglycan-binding domain-containing protein [Myxococcota bacterium]